MKVGLQVVFLALSGVTGLAGPPEPRWDAVEIDQIEIGYGLQLADVNGDKRTDIILADRKTFQWYENPAEGSVEAGNWKKHIIARNLTERDNVCITARDLDGDGRCEIAVGGQWYFEGTVKDGAVFYLVPPEDRTKLWAPVKLPNEPGIHRMHWLKGPRGVFTLAVKPLRGEGAGDGKGVAPSVLEYFKPADPRGTWQTRVISDFTHLSHNFQPVNWDDDLEEELISASNEGVWYFDRLDGEWRRQQLTEKFAGEVRDGKLPDGKRFIATVEPIHGDKSAVYVQPDNGQGLWRRLSVLSDAMLDGHAVAIADFLGMGSDQVVVGWRALHPPGVPGVVLFTPLDEGGLRWRASRVSGREIAVEDLKAGDLNGDGKPEIVIAGRQTRNLRILFNRL